MSLSARDVMAGRPPWTMAARATALGALVACVLPGVFAGGALYQRDINMVWLPQVESFVRAVAAGSWPLWDAYSGFGRPLLADPRAEVLYPPTWLNLVVGPATYYALFTVAHLFLAGWGMSRLARRHGAGELSAAAAAGVWVASGPVLSLVSMWHHLAAAAWLPWVVSAFDALVAHPSPRAVAAAGGALAAQVLAGSPDVTLLTMVVVAVEALSALVRDRGVATRLLAAGAALGLGLALSAAQWVPTLDVVRRSTRWSGGVGDASVWSQHPLALLELLVPMRWVDLSLQPAAVMSILEAREPWMRSVYVGAAAASLAVAGLTVRHPHRAAHAVLLLLGIGLALGRHGPVYPAVALLPGGGLLRFPVKALLLAAFAGSLIVAGGVQAIATGSIRARRAAAIAAAVLAVLLAGVVVAMRAAGAGHGPLGSLLAADPPRWVTEDPAVAAGLAAALALTLGLTARMRGASAALLVGILAIGDLAWRHHDLNPTAPRTLFAYRPEVLGLLDLAGGARTYVYDYSIDPAIGPRPRPWPYRVARQPEGWTPSAALVLGVHSYLNPPTAARWAVSGSYDLDILGFDPVSVDRLTRFLRQVEGTPGHLRLLQMGAVRNVLALEPAPWWRDLTPGGTVAGFFERPVQVLAVPEPLPRAYLVDGVREARGDVALGVLVHPGFDPRREVVLETAIPRATGGEPPGTVALGRLRWDLVEVAVDAQRDGRLVLVEAYDPGWKATVDGRPAAVERANVAFMSVAVPAGRHAVTLRYRPRPVVLGLATSVAGLVAACALARRGRARSGAG